MAETGNVLFVTLDQLRADAVTGRLAGFAPTPALDRLRAEGATFLGHHTVTVPCGPSRASLLTGLYAFNHRAIRNGTPLAAHHDGLGRALRRLGREPLLFGYTDATPEPTRLDPKDPDLTVYEGVAPGWRELCEIRADAGCEVFIRWGKPSEAAFGVRATGISLMLSMWLSLRLLIELE